MHIAKKGGDNPMQPDDNTAVNEVVPAETQTAEVEPQAPAVEEQAQPQTETPDYKALYEDSERRRSGLDRKLSRLTRGQTRTDEEGFLTGDENLDSAVFQHPLTQKLLQEVATRQLKEGVDDILSEYPNVPEAVIKALKANPRGFVGPDATTVEEGLEDIETYLINLTSESATAVETPKEFPVAQSNTVATEPKEKSIEQMDAEELSNAVDSGEIALPDLEKVIKEQSGGKEVKKVK